MAVKERVGRSRYVVFTLATREPKGAFERKLEETGIFPPHRLVIFNGEWGVVRSPHTRVQELLEALPSLGARSRWTTGTLASVRRRFPHLKERTHRRR